MKKLVIEVIDAHNIMPKDGEGSSSPYVEVDFDNQISRTKAIPKNLNPIWNQKLLFDFDPMKNHNRRFVEVSVYNERSLIPGRKSSLGRVRISCSNIVNEGDEVYQCFQLEKGSFLSFVRGEVGLKIYVSKESEPNSSADSCSFPSTVVSQPEKPAKTKTLHELRESSKSQCPSDENHVTLIKDREKCRENNPSSGIKVQEIQNLVTESLSESTYLVRKNHFLQRPSKKIEGIIHTTMHHRRVNNNLRGDGYDYTHHEDDEPKVKEANQLPKRERMSSSSGLVDQMFYLYVRVVKAKDLQPSTTTGGLSNPYVEVKLGNYVGRTSHHESKHNPEWNQMFAFSKERIQSSILEIFLKDKDPVSSRDERLGRVVFDLNEIPTRVPPDSPLAPQWYQLEEGIRGEIMVSIWMGTQADEAFTDSWHADSASVYGEGLRSICSKVYVSPNLWYLRVSVIASQDIVPNDKSRLPEVYVKGRVGNQVLRTGLCPNWTPSPVWNEDLVFIVSEPFEEDLVLTLEDRVAHRSKDEVLGRLTLPLASFEKRRDHRPANSRWYNLENVLESDDSRRLKEHKFSSRIHLRACLEGAYHVSDESASYVSDRRPTAKQLWDPHIGILELGILGAQGLLPMKTKDGRGSTDAYCVAKYGHKWVRTRTILDSLSPKWNEQYTWEVYDPCTVITIGMFDNCHIGAGDPGGASSARDSRIGKIRIRLSTLEAHRIYTHSYPLLVLQPSGLKKTGELFLAVRFTTLTLSHMISTYAKPLLPKMHYLHPFDANQLENLRFQAMNIVAAQLARAEPPLRKEVVEYMLDAGSHAWSMRRSKANFSRTMSVFSSVVSVTRWFEDVCNWKNPITSILVHALFLTMTWHPELILPALFLYSFFVGLWNYRFRPRRLPGMDPQLSWADDDVISPDELDEEHDAFPSTREWDIVRMRYDRLRSVAGRVQGVVGDVATQGERFEALLSWRDPRATSLFVVFCLCAAIVLYATPLRVVVVVSGLYVLRHPRFRSRLPFVASNFFKRLAPRTDGIL